MKYRDYIDLGFKRTDLSDNVEFQETGYPGYSLDIDCSDKISIGVCFPDLDKPKMYIKKTNSETYHIIQITPEIVKDLLSKSSQNLNIYAAC